ncbi:hypothetical protein AB0A94_20765 [Streptomyces sp. NPDC044984]|uniref:hypothetical protein n=1 Tax=Streptomyces sp. NPDC044984 TaxID=3154335 RepID=UPI0033E2654C
MGIESPAGVSVPVFVDSSGRRARVLRRTGYGVAGLAAAYMAMLGLSLMGATPFAPGAMLPPLPGDVTAPSAPERRSPDDGGRLPGGVLDPGRRGLGGVAGGPGSPPVPLLTSPGAPLLTSGSLLVPGGPVPTVPAEPEPSATGTPADRPAAPAPGDPSAPTPGTGSGPAPPPPPGTDEPPAADTDDPSAPPPAPEPPPGTPQPTPPAPPQEAPSGTPGDPGASPPGDAPVTGAP